MPAIVQSASATGTGTSITVTLGSGTTAVDCVLSASIASSGTNPTVTGVTLGGSADNFGHLISAGNTSQSAGIVETWADPNCAGGQTAVVVSFSAASSNGGCAFAYEASGLALSSILDQSSSAFTTSTQATFSSGTTSTTTQASELWFGAVGGFNTTITGPSSPWTNSSQINSMSKNFMVGYQVTSSTGTATYSGSYSPNSFEEASVVTLKSSGGTNVTATFGLGMAPLAQSFTAAERMTGQLALAMAPLKQSFTATETGANITAHFALPMAPLGMRFAQPQLGGLRVPDDDRPILKRWRRRRFRL